MLGLISSAANVNVSAVLLPGLCYACFTAPKAVHDLFCTSLCNCMSQFNLVPSQQLDPIDTHVLLPPEPEQQVCMCRVTKVREFQKLARNSEADGHLQQKLKQLLKLSKEKWDAACEHAKIAVQARIPTCLS